MLRGRHGQSNRDRLRHVFKDVPVIYGFSSKAPLGRTAGPLLERYFQTAPAGEVASGRASPTLLRLFGPSSMIAVAGLSDADPHAAFRGDMCALADDQPTHAQKFAFMHKVLQRDVTEVRMFLDHLERYAASIGPVQRLVPDVAAALGAIKDDHGARDRFLEFARDADQAAVQARMMALARSLGWLTPAQEQAEFVRMIVDRMARDRRHPDPLRHQAAGARRPRALAAPDPAEVTRRQRRDRCADSAASEHVADRPGCAGRIGSRHAPG